MISSCKADFDDSMTPQLELDNYSSTSVAGVQGSSHKKTGAFFTTLWIALSVFAVLLISLLFWFCLNKRRVNRELKS